MGFIKHGRSLKRRRIGSRTASPDPNSLKMSSTTSSTSSSLRQSTSIEEEDEATSFLERFPPHILYNIYILSRPRNNLKYINRRLYHTLNFDPNYVGTGTWHNLSLTLRMIQTWYLVDLNTRLDFDVLESKLHYYETNLGQVDPELKALRSPIYKIVTKYIHKIREYMVSCQSPCVQFAVSDGVLTNSFLSSQLITNCFNEVMIPNCGTDLSGEYLDILTTEEIKGETISRLKAFKVMFATVSFWLDTLAGPDVSAPTEIEESTIPKYDIKETIVGGNEMLKDYDDESSITIDVHKLSNRFQPRNFRDSMYDNGINSKRKLNVVDTLNKIHNFRFVDVNKIIANTYKNFHDPQYSTDISLEDTIELLFNDFDSLVVKGSSPLDDIFRLYDYYEKQDCTDYGLNYKGKTISDDMSSAIIKVLQLYDQLKYPMSNLWEHVFELKNHNLAQLLMTFSDTPDYKIMHSWSISD